MKISILTTTYNRKHTLPKLYESLKQNLKHNIDFEWLIMDDGSKDNTIELINEYILENKFKIKYFSQKNQGKMQALNNLVPNATGELIVEIDSDDYFTEDALKIISEKYEYIKNDENIYAMVFLKQAINAKTNFFDKDNYKTKIFDLYFKHGFIGDTTIVFKADIRKKYIHKLEKNEKFITEARMYNEIEKKYDVIYFKNYVSICEYLKGVLLKKRLYIIKHYILFSYLSNQKHILKNVKGIINKILTLVLYIPGVIKSYFFKNK